MRLPPLKPLFALLVIGGAALLAYANSLHGPFVFDDESSITTNPTIRKLWPLTEPLSPPLTNVTAQGRPILNLSLAVNYALGGVAVEGYHAVNLLIHALAGMVLFGVVRRTLAAEAGATGLALAVAVLWVVHPLQTESVTYVIQRAESLMGLFYLLTVYCFVRGTEAGGGGARWLGLAVGACALGMATKEVMATAPLMVLFYDRTFVAASFADALRRRWAFYAALFGTWLLLGWLVLQGGGNRGGSVGFGAGIEPWAYWLTQFKAVAVYLRLTIWPAPLVFEYGTFWVNGAGDIVIEALLVLGLLVVTIHGLWRRTALGFAGAWFFGVLAPTSLAPGTTQMIVEHRMYLPLAAVLAMAVVGLYRRVGESGRGAVWAGSAAVALLWGGMTIGRNADYRTDVALWSDTVAKRPANPLAHFMLAGALERAGEVPRALESYAEALRLKPNFSVGHESYGALLLRLGRRAEAITHLEEALRLQPAFPDAHMNLGNALVAEGRAGDAVRHLAEAVRLAPEFAEMHFNLANALSAAGRTAEAVAAYEAALKRPAGSPAVHTAAHLRLGNAYAMAGRPAEAVPHYEAVLRTQSDNAEAHHNLGSACLELGRFAEAVSHYEATLRLAPDFPNARAHLEVARGRLRR
jgi:tetratricopeptide (TPR) repeat protein